MIECKDVDLQKLLEEEKKARMDGEAPKSCTLCVQIVTNTLILQLKYFVEKKDYEQMRHYMAVLAKKRSQSKKAITEYIKYILNDVNSTLSVEEQIKTLKAVNEISEGKIYVEVSVILKKQYEYSVSVRRLTEIYLSQNQIEDAAKLIQDIQVSKCFIGVFLSDHKGF